MRTTVEHKKQKTFTFPMTDADVLARVDEVNELNSQELNLESKKKLIQQEMKQLKADQTYKLSCIARREEPREVECDVIFDYKDRKILTTFEGQIMSTSKMGDWEYEERPSDIYPKEVIKDAPTGTTLDAAMAAAESNQEKQANIVAPSGDVKAHSEAKTETAVDMVGQ